jgi:hypothetical protein
MNDTVAGLWHGSIDHPAVPVWHGPVGIAALQP